MSVKSTLLETVKEFPVVNTHCHHGKAELFQGMHLRRLLANTYSAWTVPVPEPESESPLPAEWFERIGLNSYFLSLQRGMQSLYGISEPLGAATWRLYDDAIRAAHADPQWHLKIMRERCGYKYIVQDSYWNTGTADGGDMFKPNYRVDMFFCVHDKNALDHDDNNALRFYGVEPFPRMEAYIGFIYDKIKAQKGIYALKCAMAYDRGIDFIDETAAEAQGCYARLISGRALPADLTRA